MVIGQCKLPVRSLFRYVLATSHGIHQITNRWVSARKTQLQCDSNVFLALTHRNYLTISHEFYGNLDCLWPLCIINLHKLKSPSKWIRTELWSPTRHLILLHKNTWQTTILNVFSWRKAFILSFNSLHDPFLHDMTTMLSVDSTYFVSVAVYYCKGFPVLQICT